MALNIPLRPQLALQEVALYTLFSSKSAPPPLCPAPTSQGLELSLCLRLWRPLGGAQTQGPA